VFHEDLSRTRKDNSAENFAVIRHIALNILKNFPAKMSLARKRRKCIYDVDFMADVLLSAF
ncbi:MAG: ISAs1 family transposase, partial [Oscillospiraceae bacterium]|nr:ISAs1 family transposase [Oscillospiraceae bacterium]